MKKIFEVNFLYRSMLKFATGRDPFYNPRVMILTNLNPHVLMMLRMKYQSSSAYNSQEDDFLSQFPV